MATPATSYDRDPDYRPKLICTLTPLRICTSDGSEMWTAGTDYNSDSTPAASYTPGTTPSTTYAPD